MPVNQSRAVARTATLDAAPRSVPGSASQTAGLIAISRQVRATIGWSGIAAWSSGIVLAVSCTVWAIEIGVPHPLAIMAGYCTLAGGACLSMALLRMHDAAIKPQVVGSASRQPNYPAWKLVSKFRVSDASRLWCDIEPGSPSSQESIAWAQAMLDAVTRGELPVCARPGATQEINDRERTHPTWRTEIARDALKSWAQAHGHLPRFLEG